MSNDNDIQKRAFDFAKWAGGYMAPKCPDCGGSGTDKRLPLGQQAFIRRYAPESLLPCPTCAAALEWRDKEWKKDKVAGCCSTRCGICNYQSCPSCAHCDSTKCSTRGNPYKYEPSKDNPIFCACSFIKELERIGIWEEIKGRLTVDDTHNLPALLDECEKFKEARDDRR